MKGIDMTVKRTIGFRVLMILGALMLVMLLAGQMMSYISYEFTVSFGLQEPADVVGEMGVAANKGFGVGDTMVYLPLLLAGMAGLWLRKEWGVFAMAGAMAITAYWPMVCLFLLIFAKGSPGFHFTDYASYAVLLSSFTLFGLWGFWYLYRNRKLLTSQ